MLAAWSRGHPPRDAASALALGEALFNHGLYFDCHEYLEAWWRAASEPWKTCFQGVIQLGAGFHKVELSGSSGGAAELIVKGLDKIAAAKTLRPEAVAALESALRPVAAELRAGRFALERAPRIRLL